MARVNTLICSDVDLNCYTPGTVIYIVLKEEHADKGVKPQIPAELVKADCKQVGSEDLEQRAYDPHKCAYVTTVVNEPVYQWQYHLSYEGTLTTPENLLITQDDVEKLSCSTGEGEYILCVLETIAGPVGPHVPSSLINTIAGNLIATHQDGAGNSVDIFETVTSLVNNGDGTYTYTNEAGSPTIITVGTGSGTPSAVTNTVTGNRIATHTPGGGSPIDIFETITTFTVNPDNSITYVNEAGTPTTYTPPTANSFTCADLSGSISVADDPANSCIKNIVLCAGTADEAIAGSIDLSGLVDSIAVDAINPNQINLLGCDGGVVGSFVLPTPGSGFTCSDLTGTISVRPNAGDPCIQEIVLCAGTVDESVAGSINLSAYGVSIQIDPTNPRNLQLLGCGDVVIAEVLLPEGQVETCEIVDCHTWEITRDVEGNELFRRPVGGKKTDLAGHGLGAAGDVGFFYVDATGEYLDANTSTVETAAQGAYIVIDTDSLWTFEALCMPSPLPVGTPVALDFNGDLVNANTIPDTAPIKQYIGRVDKNGCLRYCKQEVKLCEDSCCEKEFSVLDGADVLLRSELIKARNQGTCVAVTIDPDSTTTGYKLGVAENKCLYIAEGIDTTGDGSVDSMILHGAGDCKEVTGYAPGTELSAPPQDRVTNGDFDAGQVIDVGLIRLGEVRHLLGQVDANSCFHIKPCCPQTQEEFTCKNREFDATQVGDEALLAALQNTLVSGNCLAVTPDPATPSGFRLAVAEDCVIFIAEPKIKDDGLGGETTDSFNVCVNGEKSTSYPGGTSLVVIPQSQVSAGSGQAGDLVDINSLVEGDAQVFVGNTGDVGCLHVNVGGKVGVGGSGGDPGDPELMLSEDFTTKGADGLPDWTLPIGSNTDAGIKSEPYGTPGESDDSQYWSTLSATGDGCALRYAPAPGSGDCVNHYMKNCYAPAARCMCIEMDFALDSGGAGGNDMPWLDLFYFWSYLPDGSTCTPRILLEFNCFWDCFSIQYLNNNPANGSTAAASDTTCSGGTVANFGGTKIITGSMEPAVDVWHHIKFCVTLNSSTTTADGEFHITLDSYGGTLSAPGTTLTNVGTYESTGNLISTNPEIDNNGGACFNFFRLGSGDNRACDGRMGSAQDGVLMDNYVVTTTAC